MKKLIYLAGICIMCQILTGCKTAKPAAVTPPVAARAFSAPLPFAPLAAAPPVGTKTLTLAWDAVPDTAVVGYRFYQGSASRNYNISTNILGKVTTYQATIGPGTFYFAVKAADTNGLLSDFSNEISYTWVYVPPITNTVITLRLVTDQASTAMGPWIAAFTNTIAIEESEFLAGNYFYRIRPEIVR